jgi:hypothetical protein
MGLTDISMSYNQNGRWKPITSESTMGCMLNAELQNGNIAACLVGVEQALRRQTNSDTLTTK